MANTINKAGQFTADQVAYIQRKVLMLAQRDLVLYQFGQKLTLPKGHVQYIATLYDRVSLPAAPLVEGVPPAGEVLPVATVTATALQWGDIITVTDVADMTIEHSPFEQAAKLIHYNMKETLERNTINALLAGTQVNYVNSRGARASLQNTDVINAFEVERARVNLEIIGAPFFDGTMEEDVDIEAGTPTKASNSPRAMPHYVAVMDPQTTGDFRKDSTVVTAWSYSDINRLYNSEAGEWGSLRFCKSNYLPTFTGVAAVTATGHTTGGNLPDGTYYVQVTGASASTGYESQIYQVASSVTITGGSGNGSITLTTPATTGYVYQVYVDTVNPPAHLGLSPQGPSTGSLTGQAATIAPSTAVTITGIGTAQVAPAAPATGVTVHITFVFGQEAYGQVMLDEPEVFNPTGPDKFDPLDQLRVIGWKIMYSTIILRNPFMMRIESGSAFTGAFA